MEKTFLALFVFFVTPVLSAQTLPYGYTATGDFFVKESLADACGPAGETIQIAGDFNKWEYQNMVLIDKDHNLSTTDDGYYILRTGKRYKSGSKVVFVIKINGETWFPECTLEQINASDYVSNKDGNGHNLKMSPTSDISFD